MAPRSLSGRDIPTLESLYEAAGGVNFTPGWVPRKKPILWSEPRSEFVPAHWTYEVLTPANRQWLAALPRGPIDVDDVVEICHGAPFDEDAYIFDELDAVRALKTSQRPLCLFGHTHWPVMFELADGRVDTIGSTNSSSTHLFLRPESKYLLNPGSVGQPRDGDPRAAYGLVDTSAKSVDLYRVDYPIETTQAKVIKVGLPEVLAQRLAVGR